MDNEEDYIELHRLLAKCKFNLQKERANILNKEIADYYEKKIKEIDTFIINIPIIIKGEVVYENNDKSTYER